MKLLSDLKLVLFSIGCCGKNRCHDDCHHHHDEEFIFILSKINQKLDTIMANIQELTQQVADLQVALDAEQEQIMAAIAALEEQIANLEALVVNGGTEEERQALSDALTAIKIDLEGTIP